MNAKLIKDCKITRITGEQRFEPIVKTSAHHSRFSEIFAYVSSSISTALLFTVMFRSLKVNFKADNCFISAVDFVD